MVKRILCILAMCGIFSVCCFSQNIKTVSGEYTYHVPENVDLEKAKLIALDRVKIKLIADEFGTVVSQTNSTTVKNRNGKSDIDFISIGGSEVKGEWLETIGEPNFKPSFENGQLIINVQIKGKIREIVSANIDFKASVLRNGTEDKYEDDTFNNGDDLFLSFTSPICGYIVVYLIDNDGTAFCLLPYQNQEHGNVKINANERYVFFSEKLSPQDLKPYVDEYTMTCSHSQELNQIYVVFSPNTFVKAIDGKREEALPRELSNEDFQKWLAKNRSKDKEMIYKKFSISIKKLNDMATIDIKSIISFQKQFDTLTATLNIFDMSFLVSGAAMLGACLYAFPNVKDFFIHSNHIFLSVLLCIIFAYIFGLICRIAGKNISDWLCMNVIRKSCKKDFSSTFSTMLMASSIKSPTIQTMIDKGQEMMAYSYMWMKLDSCSNADCRNRFLYVSRIWVLRAIYEGLIVPLLLLAATICLKSCISPEELLGKDLYKVLNNHSGCVIIPIVVFLTCSVIYLLSKEADHCNDTQMREIISAYSDFIESSKFAVESGVVAQKEKRRAKTLITEDCFLPLLF